MNFSFSEEELKSYFTRLHKRVHWLLVYKEENFPTLSAYFDYILYQLKGLQSLYPDIHHIMELVVLIRAAKIESEKEDYDHFIYRKSILDAHGIIEEIEKELSKL